MEMGIRIFFSFLFSLLLLLLPFSSSVHFQISRFGPEANMLYQGDASPAVGSVELINKVTYLCRVGWAFYADRIPIWDSKTGKLTDFTTHFTFTIDIQGRPKYGHGMAFFLAPVGFQIPPNSAGGFLGLFNTTTSDLPTNQMVLVEFDSFSNPEWDPPYEHVGINNGSISSVVTTPWNASLHSDDTGSAWITFNATTKNLTVSWSYEATTAPKENSTLSCQLDLKRILPEQAMVGFSAATGQYVARHVLQSWEFSSSLDIEETNQQNAKKTRLKIGLMVPLGALVLGVLVAAAIILWRRRSRAKAKSAVPVNPTSINDDLERGAGPRRYSYIDLASATSNFSEERKLGEGGFGGVYRGYLKDLNMEVAVKKISRGSRQGKKEYITEVKVISHLRHRNLVQLVGWCHDKSEFLLVYEFMPNGSLDSHLFGKNSPPTWAVRYKIGTGLASALLYLHEEWEQCVVHRDVKSSNVMLDSSFNVKLGDFGLARLMDHEVGPQTTGLAGTFGYMAPEYVGTGRASKESDVYSFGVVLLEIATGKKSLDPRNGGSQIGLVEWVWDLYGSGQLLSAVDERMNGKFEGRQAECLMIAGLWCAYPDRSRRASIKQAIQVLHFEAALPDLPPKMPVPVYRAPAGGVSASSSSEPSITCSSIEVGR
ncbi:L-type lectin-domain containing receptor kinase IX.1-like isoform X1 [Diospyros lotus]|uniref:L-type lectin-domain containing receptor kinase IX.1-like isoform X1 n=1 Tax=Diospyros lotus TaxID=55363 RepID=UPI0022588957|nr:L-type lectin-domain containing receptor kinase IX.1-like isoform X1 [Diospyros lotus]